MAFLITCPACKARLKSSQAVPAGREVVCPHCKATFTLSQPAEAALANEPSPASPPETRVGPPPLPPKRAKKESIPEASIPDALIEDDEPPRRKSSKIDVNELPRRSQRRPADDDYTPPPKREIAVDPEDDDREDDRPPRRKKGSKKLMLGALGGIAALLLFCGGGAVMYFVDPFGLFGSSGSDMFAWVPSDSQVLTFTDVERVSKVDELKDSSKAGGNEVSKFGLRSDDVASILQASRGLGIGNPDAIVIKLRASADRQKIINTSGATEATSAGKTYYKTRSGGGLYFVSSKLLVVTQTEATMTTLLQAGGSSKISEDLRTAANRGRGVMWVAAAGQGAKAIDFIKMLATFGSNPIEAFGGQTFQARYTSFSMDVSGAVGNGRFESTYSDAATAKKLADDVRKAIADNRAKFLDMESHDISVSGSTVTFTVSGPIKKTGPMPFGF